MKSEATVIVIVHITAMLAMDDEKWQIYHCYNFCWLKFPF